jgi:protein-S-isoprenylcysteine O-methyltransferase Ste14
MSPETLLLRKGLVLGSALVYWAGVFIQARRIRKQIGRSPNIGPRGSKERLLWLGWLIVILGWFGQPFFLNGFHSRFFSLIPALLHSLGLALGIVLVAGGYGGTLWCYAALGDAWRIGIRKREKTALVNRGPYRLVRHPIYLFQTVMLAGVVLLVPTPFLIILFGIHLACIFIKAFDEETYLADVHGPAYLDYLSKTGRFLPRFVKGDERDRN